MSAPVIATASRQTYRTAPDESLSGMPPGIPYIIGNEAAERFSFYGMRTILMVFMTQFLMNRAGQKDLMPDVDARVEVSDDRISMRIENSRGNSKNGRESKSGSGRGLRGIFERAALLGGQVEAGPTKDGWVVSGWVPRVLPPGGVSV